MLNPIERLVSTTQGTLVRPKILPVNAIFVFAALVIACAGCGGGGDEDGSSVDLDVLNPLVTDVDLEPGASYEITFEPRRGGLEIVVDEAPSGVTASIEPGPTEQTMILAVDVAGDITARGAINIVLAVDEQGEMTLVPWPFNLVDN